MYFLQRPEAIEYSPFLQNQLPCSFRLSLGIVVINLKNYHIIIFFILLFETVMSRRPKNIKLIKNKPIIQNLDVSYDIHQPDSEDLQSEIRISYDSIKTPYLHSKNHSMNELFITQRKGSQVDTSYRLLNDYIDVLDMKVSALIEKHEAEFLVAYRNHVNQVRQEMQELRNKSQNNAKSAMSQTEQIEALQKKLILFRQESLKMFEKVTEKQKIIYELNKKINDLQSDNARLLDNLKLTTKRNKYLEGKNSMEENSQKPQLKIQTSAIELKYSVNARPYSTTTKFQDKTGNTRSQSIHLQRNTNSQSSSYEIDSLKMKIDFLLQNVDVEVKNKVKNEVSDFFSKQKYKNREQVHKTRTSIGSRQRHYKTSIKFTEEQSIVNFKKQEMEQYFHKCIQAVRKDISRRKNIQSLNFYKENKNITVQEFKKIDFFRLLEMLLSHERVILALYQSIFTSNQDIC